MMILLRSRLVRTYLHSRDTLTSSLPHSRLAHSLSPDTVVRELTTRLINKTENFISNLSIQIITLNSSLSLIQKNIVLPRTSLSTLKPAFPRRKGSSVTLAPKCTPRASTLSRYAATPGDVALLLDGRYTHAAQPCLMFS